MKISFIVPAYKTPEKLLARCLASIEWFCRDSGIEYETIIISDPVVQSIARNIGLRRAVGDWIWFIDADDEVVAGMDVVAAAKNAVADIIVFAFEQRWGRFGSRTRFVPPIDFRDKLSEECIVREGKCQMFRVLWNKLFRRSFLEEKKIMFDECMEPCEDGMFMIRCVMAGARWYPIDSIGYIYWRRLSSSLFRYCPTLERAIRKENSMWDAAVECLSYKNLSKCKWSDRTLLLMLEENRINAGAYDNVSLLSKIRYRMVQFRRLLRYIKI